MSFRDDWRTGMQPALRFLGLLLCVGLGTAGCEVGWQGSPNPPLNPTAAVASARAVANWAADSSGCPLEVVSVEHEKRVGSVSALSEEIADRTPILNGVRGCDDILTPNEVQEQDVYPTGSRSNYRSVMETLLADSPTAADHVVKVDWNSPNGQFSTFTAVNADSLKVLFSPVGTVLGSDAAPPSTSTSRSDSFSQNSTPETTWTPEGDEETLVWQDSLTVQVADVATAPLDHGQALAKTAPEITTEWNSGVEFSESSCTLDGTGIVRSSSVDPGISTFELYSQLVETDTRAEWSDGTCSILFQVDVGIAEGTASMSSAPASNGPGFDISKSGRGQFWTFRRTYQWKVTE